MSVAVLPGVYRGVVTRNNDPEGRARVKVRVPAVNGAGEFDWALPCASGSVELPELGSAVWVAFEHGDPDFPVWMGTWLLHPSQHSSNGLSAYDLAVQQGFTGTLDEWLASLVGPPGPAGDPVGYRRYVDLGNPPAIAGVAHASAELHEVYAIMAATSAGSSSAAALGLVRRVAGRADGTSAASGVASIIHAISAQSDGAATSSAVIATAVSLQTSADGTSSASGSLSSVLGLAASSAGSATASAAATETITMSASSTGSSTASGSLAETLVLTASPSVGASTSSGDLVLSRGTSSTSAGSSTATGDLAVASSSSPTPAPFGSQMFGS